MSWFMNRKATVSLALTLVLLLAGCGQGGKGTGTGSDGKPVYGGTLTVAVPTDPDGLDPHRTAAAATDEIAVNIYEGLVGADPKGNVVPALAREWKISPDGTEYTFFLKDKVYFHNGRELTADDVKFSLERIMAPETAHPRAADFGAIKEIQVIDQKTVKIILSRYDAAFLSTLAAVNAAIVPREAVAELKEKPVGTGPFKFVEWLPQQQVKLVRFDKYHENGLPYLDEVVFKIIPEPATALMNLKTGAIDVIPRLEGEHAAEVEKGAETKIFSGPQNLVQLMAINNARKPFDDRRVRQAIVFAIDKKALLDGAAWGYGTLVGSHMSPQSPYYVDLNAAYDYDPEKAKALLAEAGYPNGFETTITLPEPYQFHRRTGEIIADQLSKVGIKANLKVVEWGKWLDEVYKQRQFDLTVIGHVGKLDPHGVLGRYASDRKDNYMNFKSEEVDRLLKEGLAAVDPEQRKKIYGQVQRILAQEVASFYIMDPHQIVALRKNVQGWEIFPVYVSDVRRVYKTR